MVQPSKTQRGEGSRFLQKLHKMLDMRGVNAATSKSDSWRTAAIAAETSKWKLLIPALKYLILLMQQPDCTLKDGIIFPNVHVNMK